MSNLFKIGMVSTVLAMTACTSPHLITDSNGNACHANYHEVRKEYGSHFARPCQVNLESSENLLQTSESDFSVNQGLMADPKSFDNTQGIYTRQGANEKEQYYWMLPYSVAYANGVENKNFLLESRWFNQQKQSVRLFVYDKEAKRDLTNINFEIDGQTMDYVATWPSEKLDGHHTKMGNLQYFDVNYATLKQVAQAHQANITLFFGDGTQEQVVLVAQGEPSAAASGLRRFFNAIETR